MTWEILAGAATIISTLIALLTFLHLLERSRPQPLSGGQPVSQGLSWPSVLACVVSIGIFAAVFRQLGSCYLITVVGLQKKVPPVTAFGVEVFGGGFIVKYVTIWLWALLVPAGAAAFAQRYGEHSEDLPVVAYLACAGSMLLAMFFLSEPLQDWWVASIAPLPE